MRWLIICALLASCASESKPPSDEGGFLKAMEQEFPGSNKEYNLDSGKNICFKLRSGKTQEEVIMEKFDNGMSISNAGLVVGLSIQFLCSEFKDSDE